MQQIQVLSFITKEHLFLLLIFLFCIIASLRIMQFPIVNQNHYILLANSFLNTKTNLPLPLPETAEGDIVFYKEKAFVKFGPLPAILLLPSVAIFKNLISQHTIGLFLLLIDFFLIFKIAKKSVTNSKSAFWLSLFFIFGTIFANLALINFTSYQVQIISVSFIIFAIYEYTYNKRWFLIGLFISFAGLTRPTVYLASVFFIIEIIRLNQNKLHSLIFFLIPIFISIIILGAYNFVRFDNFFDTGYRHEKVIDELKENASKGVFSIKHIPENLYYLFLKGLDPVKPDFVQYSLYTPYFQASHWGLGIFFTSPLFLYIFWAKPRKELLSCWITILIMLIPILTYFGIGIWQYGYRYAVDFYPFLFLILTHVFRKSLPLKAKALILYSIFFNFYFMLSIWGVYPF